jgi:chromosome segregation ATPase
VVPHAPPPQPWPLNLVATHTPQEIEGFEDDFMERVDEEEDDQYYDEYDDEDDKGDLGPTVEELVDRGQLEQQRLTELNEMLQRRSRLALDLRNKGRPPVNKDLARLDGVSTRYRSALKLWVDTLEERDRVEGHYQTTIFDMKSMLEERIKRADDISKAYKHFKMEVAKTAEHSKSGRSISEGLLGRLEGEDLEKEEEVQRVRLKNIHLSNQLKRIEQTLRQKEELAEGLHLIDFEQLKIENQSLNEKIEERNEELLNLRKKTTTTVQILTHVREKLQFVEKDNASLGDTLRDFDGQLSEKRDAVGKVVTLTRRILYTLYTRHVCAAHAAAPRASAGQ